MFETKYKRRHYGARLISAYQLTHDRKQAEELVTHLKSRFGEHTVSLRYSNLLVAEIPDRLEICRAGKLAVTVHVNEWLVMEERQPLRVLADQAFHEQFEAVDPKNIVTLTVNSFVEQSKSTTTKEETTKGSDEMQMETYKARGLELKAVWWKVISSEQLDADAVAITQWVKEVSQGRASAVAATDSMNSFKSIEITEGNYKTVVRPGNWVVMEPAGTFAAIPAAFFAAVFTKESVTEDSTVTTQPKSSVGEGMPKRRMSLTMSSALERAVRATRSHAEDIVRSLEEPSAVGSIRDILVEQIDADREAADVLEGWLKRDGHPFITELEPGERGSKEVGYIKRQRGY